MARPAGGTAAAVADLERFVQAQGGGVHEQALAELRAGRKRSHWMWFVFPQLAGLGRSATAARYALAGADEARAFAAHPVLGPRLRTCCQALLDSGATDPVGALGPVDAVKLRSSMTLFAHVDPGEPVYRQVLERFYGGEPDPLTEELLVNGG